eukprot:SAG11_NODE_41110_length_198_cov_12.646465_1_plen_52_part_01
MIFWIIWGGWVRTPQITTTETLFELDIYPIGAVSAPTLTEFNDDDDFDAAFR